MSLLVGPRAVLYATRNDEQLAWRELDVAVAHLNRELPLQYEEEVLGLLVRMPDELPLRLDHLELVVVQVADDLRTEVVAERGELLGEIDFVFHHGHLPFGR